MRRERSDAPASPVPSPVAFASPSPKNPRWLWESVALYDAGEIVDPRTLGFMTAGQPPTLAELNRIEDTRIYQMGALVGAFVVDTWGREALRDLVRTNGVLPAFGMDEAVFASRRFQYARARYAF